MKKRIATIFLGVVILSILLAGCFFALSENRFETPAFIPSTPKGQNGLVLILELDKTSYHGGEPILGTLTIKNVDLRKVLVNKRMTPSASYDGSGAGEVAFIVTSLNNKNLELGYFGVHPVPFSDDDYVVLTVGQGIQFSEYRIDLFFEGRLDKTGKYTIQGFYANKLDPYDGRVAWKGTLESNKFEFEYQP